MAALVFAATFDVNRYRATIQSELENRLGRKVTLGDMHLSVFPPRFRVLNISISDDPRFSTQKPFVQAQQLDVSVKLLPLLTKSVQIDSLGLKRPSVELIKNKQGVWNFVSLGKVAIQSRRLTSPRPGRPSRRRGQARRQPRSLLREGEFALRELLTYA